MSLQILSLPEGEQIAQHMVLIDQPSFILGRDVDCDIMLPDGSKSVSRRHAELILTAGAGGAIRDLSTNGTLLNGKKLPSGDDSHLQDGDLLSIGGYQILVSLPAEQTQKPPVESRTPQPEQKPAGRPTFAVTEEGDETEFLIPEAGHEFQVAHDNFENVTTDFPTPNAIMMDPFEDSDGILDRALDHGTSLAVPTQVNSVIVDPFASFPVEQDPGHSPLGLPDPFDGLESPSLDVPVETQESDSAQTPDLYFVHDPFEDGDNSPVDDPNDRGLVRQMASYRHFCTQSCAAALVTFLCENSPDALSMEMDPSLEPGSLRHWSKFGAFYADKLQRGDFSQRFNEHLIRELNKW